MKHFVPASCNTTRFQPPTLHADALYPCLSPLVPQNGQAVDVPEYDFTKHQRSSETTRMEPADVVIIEGILVLHMEGIRGMLNMKIYVDTGMHGWGLCRRARRRASLATVRSRALLVVACCTHAAPRRNTASLNLAVNLAVETAAVVQWPRLPSCPLSIPPAGNDARLLTPVPLHSQSLMQTTMSAC